MRPPGPTPCRSDRIRPAGRGRLGCRAAHLESALASALDDLARAAGPAKGAARARKGTAAIGERRECRHAVYPVGWWSG